MAVDSVQSSVLDTIVSQYTTTSVEEDDAMGKEDFLEILIAQLEYQDPLNPMEGTDMTGQLAQFSMLEQQCNTNEWLEQISAELDAQANNSLLDYLGKEIMMVGSIITIDNGEVSGGYYTIEEPADVEIVIYDSEENEVDRLYFGQMEAGSHDVDWDGKDSSGTTMEDDTYVYDVIATDEDSQYVSAETRYAAKVTGVSYENETPYLMVGDLFVDPETVIRVCT
jgi:flagellar basal-body rod modification protein FlgD